MSDTRATPFISIKQAIDRLNGAVGKSLLYEMVATGQLRHTRLGSRVLIDRDHLDQILAENLRGPSSPVAVAAPQASQETPAASQPARPPAEAPKGRARHRRRQTEGGIVLW
jgi:excisionase family DNA binding protein